MLNLAINYYIMIKLIMFRICKVRVIYLKISQCNSVYKEQRIKYRTMQNKDKNHMITSINAGNVCVVIQYLFLKTQINKKFSYSKKISTENTLIIKKQETACVMEGMLKLSPCWQERTDQLSSPLFIIVQWIPANAVRHRSGNKNIRIKKEVKL